MQGHLIKAAFLMVLSSVAIAIMSALEKAVAPFINTVIVVIFYRYFRLADLVAGANFAYSCGHDTGRAGRLNNRYREG